MSSSESSSTNTYSLNLLSMPLLQVVSDTTHTAAKATVNAVSNQFKGRDADTSVTIAPPQPTPETTIAAPTAPAPESFHPISRSDTDDSIVSEASDDAAPEPITESLEEGDGEAEFQPAPAYSAVDGNLVHGIHSTVSLIHRCCFGIHWVNVECCHRTLTDTSTKPPTSSIVDRSEHAAPMPEIEHGAGIGESGYSSF